MPIQGAVSQDYNDPDSAPEGIELELLSRDFRSSYLLPFPVRRRDGHFHDDVPGEVLDTDIIGWRPWASRAQHTPRRRPKS
jgi:hypothetical protein